MRGPENAMFVEKEEREPTEWGQRVGLPRKVTKADSLSHTRKSGRMLLQEQTHKLLIKIVMNWFTSSSQPCHCGRDSETLNMGFPLLVKLGVASHSTSSYGDILPGPSVPI